MTLKKKKIEVANWTVSCENEHIMIIERIPADDHTGSVTKKAVKVEDSSEYTFKALKTKIKAAGGAIGLIAWMNECIAQHFCECLVRSLLNYAWDEIKPANYQ